MKKTIAQKTEISKERVEEFIEMISNIAALKFEQRVSVKSGLDYDDILAQGLNMLAEEWMDTVTSKEKLLQSERQYNQLFQNSYDAIFIFNAQSSALLEINKAALKLINETNHNGKTYFEHLLRFENVNFESILDELNRQDGNTFIIDQLLLPGDKEITAEFTAALVDTSDGKLLQVNLRDISERHKAQIEKDRLFQLMRNSEYQYRSLFESSSMGILLVEPKTGLIIKANKAMEEILDFTPNELRSQSIYDIIPENLRNEYGVIMSLLESEGKLTIETERLNKSGKSVPVETTLSMTVDSDGSPIIITNVRDITERQQANLIRKVTYNIAKKLNSIDIEISEICAFIQTELSEIMPSENFYIALDAAEDLNYIYLHDQFTFNKAPFNRNKTNGLNEYIIDNVKTVRLVGADAADFHEKNRVNIYGITPKSWLGAPIISGGEAIGLIAVQSYDEYFAYTESHEQLISLLGSELGMFLERAKERQERDQILSMSRDLICIANTDGYFKYVNPAFSTLLGFSKAELLATPYLDFVHADDVEKTKEFLALLDKDTSTLAFENRYLTKEGEPRLFSWIVTPNPEAGTIYGIARDITEQQKIQDELAASEKKYRGLFDKMDEGLLFSNQKGRIEMVNPSLCKILGYSSDDLVGKIGYEILHPEKVGKELRENIAKRKEGSSGVYETKFLHKTGKIVWATISAHPHYNSEGKFDGVMSIISDISERKRIELEKERAYDKVKENEEKLREEHKSTLQYQSMLLSSQLNPHFIFNSLNSIQFHILEQDPEPSLIFLSRFAQLMRNVLRNSTNEVITLKEEIDFLTVYMELEKSRHKNKFDFSIDYDEEINPDEYFIPPMLIQPYAENSIIHGIGHLVEDGFIQIKFYKTSENSICCEITDNGIGRDEAQKRNILKEGEKTSYSSIINQNRIDILNKLEGGGYATYLKDLKEDTNELTGTQVIIRFPLIEEN